ncbi:MAG: GTPase HflX [Limnobacter sp.]|nr:GTPase HflX [Limnobacter sp.]
MTKTALVAVNLGQAEFEESFDELGLLAASAGAQVVLRFQVNRKAIDSATFIGSGKVQEILLECEANEVELVVFNHQLSPAQQRNLEQILGLTVLDRTGLILDIFAIRAQSHEGKLQVELAQLEYLSSRLVRRHAGLSGQQGGIGMRGPGETQLETDRRLIGSRMVLLKSKLAKLQKQRQTQRKRRERTGQFTVAIVGYTNAGKSTLFNTLASGKAYTADQLFATLDTTSRKVFLKPGVDMVLMDTVGFVRDLSHSLIEAFKATLETTVQADLLLHVVDLSSPDRHAQIREVNKVLADIDAGDIPQLVVWNKIDACAREPEVQAGDDGTISSVFVSARHNKGLDMLRKAIAEFAESHYERSRNFQPDSLSDY